MDVLHAIQERHSARAFTDEPVAADDIDEIVRAAAAAPSPRNTQPWHFHVAMGTTRHAVGEIIAQSTVFLAEYLAMIGPDASEQLEAFYADLGRAPVVVAVSVPPVDDDQSARVNTYLSAGCAIENLLLASAARGLGACNITFPHWVRDQLMEAFRVPAEREIVSLIIVGHPDGPPVAPAHDADVATILD